MNDLYIQGMYIIHNGHDSELKDWPYEATNEY